MRKYFLITVCILCFVFMDVYAKSLSEIMESGVIKIGMRSIPLNFIIDENGEYKGFNYDLVKMFADYLGVEIELVEIESFNTYFLYNGIIPENVRTDDEIKYTPDIFKNDIIDIAAEPITRLPWREKLFNLVMFIKNKQIVYTDNDNLLKKRIDVNKIFFDFKNVSFIIRNHTSFKDNFDKNIKHRLEGVSASYTDEDDNRCIQSILEGKYDFGIMDAITFLRFNMQYDRRLAAVISVSSYEELCWAFSKECPDLKNKLLEFFNDYMTEEKYNKLFIDNFGISYKAYLSLIIK